MTRGLVFDIQHYAVHDGPGIRTLVFLKGCPLRCPWCCNPESQAFVPELRRSALRCRACGCCREACSGGRGPATPDFDRLACATCASWPCLDACPHAALGRAGREMEVAEVVAEVLKDRPFYDNSGGGVTLSGGEPLSQPEFAFDLLGALKAEGLHTALETCGVASPGTFARIAPLVDLFLFDLKIADPARHLEVLGAPLAPVLENLRSLALGRAGDVVVRVPIVPGFTADGPNLSAIADLASGLGLSAVELEPYHPTGEEKYRELGRSPCPALEGAALTEADLEGALAPFREKGVRVTVAGF